MKYIHDTVCGLNSTYTINEFQHTNNDANWAICKLPFKLFLKNNILKNSDP